MEFSSEPASRRSPIAVSAFSPSRLRRLLVARTSSRRSAPWSARTRATCEPRNPVAPVTKAFKGKVSILGQIMNSSAGLRTSVKRFTYSRIGRRRESAARHRARFPRPNYHGRAVRPECERASRREVHGSCRPPSQRLHNQKAQARHARHCSATRLRRVRRAATISIPAGVWHGRWSDPRCERVQISLFRTFAIRREFQNASELFRVSAYLEPPPRNGNWLRADLSRGKRERILTPLLLHHLGICGQREQREVIAIEVVHQIKHTRESRAREEGLIPRTIFSLGAQQVSDAASY